MGLQAITPGPHTSKPAPGHRVYPYLLRGVEIERVHQAWGTDITYIPMRHGFMYLSAVIDWYSRYVLSWELSNSLDSLFCIAALERALFSLSKIRVDDSHFLSSGYYGYRPQKRAGHF